ncbi:MAG: hypothetical protein AABO57_23655 [Acidobacteriota bacterium]
MFHQLRFFLLALALLVLFLAQACVGTNRGEPPAKAVTKNGPAVKVALFLDRTGSWSEMRIKPVAAEDIKPLLDLIAQTGGEIAFGIIREQSNRPLVRARIDPPPVKPEEPKKGNPLKDVEERAKYQTLRAKYDDDKRQWESDKDQKLQRFLAEIKPLVDQEPDARVTDIWNAVARAELFLLEKDSSAAASQHSYLVLITDGLETASGKPVVLKSQAKVVLVNGAGKIGALEPLNPIRFEGLEAAMRWISATELGEKKNAEYTH